MNSRAEKTVSKVVNKVVLQRDWVKPVSVVLGIAILTSCGGSDDPPSVDPEVLNASTQALKDSASANIGGSLDTTLDGVADVTSGGDSTDGSFADDDNGIGQLWNDDAQNLIDTSLALGGDESNTTRDGTRITIDPDDAAVCSENAVDMSADQIEFERCKALVADMTVQLDATTETDGTLTYFFQSQPLATIGYTPTSNSMELNFGTLKSLIDADNNLNPDAGNESPLDTLSGAVRLSANLTNATEGAEAGTVALEVTQPIAIASADAATTMSLGIGKVIAFSADVASETASMELAIGALQASTDEDGSVSSMDMKGLTAIIDLDANSEQLVVRNLGIGQGPLKLALDNKDVLNLGLDTFGFRVSELGDEITFDGALNLRVLMNEVLEDNTVSDTLFSLLEITAPAGTRISEQFNGSLMVASGGPLSYSLTTTDEDGSSTNQIVVDAGQCADDVADFDTEYQLVNCQ